MAEFKMPGAPLAKPAPLPPPPLFKEVEKLKEEIVDKEVEKTETVEKEVEIAKAAREALKTETAKKPSALQIEYDEPSWSGLPPSENPYSIEELKNGTIVKEHKLVGKSYFVIGRLPNNDIQMEHPTLSRHHALLQYKSEGSADKPVGFYLYDLGSTHGTCHNKNKCFPKTFYRLRVGHGIKVAGSTRLLILQGNFDITHFLAGRKERSRKNFESRK